MEKKYFIGIDFGHEFTSVSRVPGYNNEEISSILLRRSSFVNDKKVMSAICKHNDGWHFVWPEDDITRIEIRQGFKGIIKELDPISKEAFGEFAKLVFRNVLENDQDLIYNENTGESNFTICIACPSYWHHKDPQIPKEYLIFSVMNVTSSPLRCVLMSRILSYYTIAVIYHSQIPLFFKLILEHQQ